MTTIDHKNTVKRIERTFLALSIACAANKNWGKFLDIIRTEEKNHRRFCPSGLRCGLTLGQAVKLFACTSIFERFIPQRGGERMFTPEAKDFFAVRVSIFAACAIAWEQAGCILGDFTKPEMNDFLARVDYAELNQDPGSLKAA
jgi:hypothetical protein